MSNTFLYIMATKNGDDTAPPCKIGISNNPESRLITIQTSSPLRLTLFKSFAFPLREMAVEVERYFHVRHRDRRLHGEWFNINPDEATQFASLLILVLIKIICCNLDEMEIRRICEQTGVPYLCSS